MIQSPTTLINSGQHSRHVGPSSSTNNDTATLHKLSSALLLRQKKIFECCGIIVYKADLYIICEHNFLPPRLGINIYQLNSLYGKEPNDTPREWNSQPPAVHFKSRNSIPKISPVVSDIMGKLNHIAIDNSYIEVHP